MMMLRLSAVVTVISIAIAGAVAGLVEAISGFEAIRLAILVAVLFLLTEGLLLYGVLERRAPIFGRIVWKGPKHPKSIALTFDDGPNEPYTSHILDILKEFDVRATFFLIGENVERFPEVVRRHVVEGHEIGNHTYSHDALPLKFPGRIRDELRRTSQLIHRTTGVRPRFFRAPHGWRNPWMGRVAKEEGCVPVAWTLGVWDTDRPGAHVIVERTLSGLGSGCILLLHDGRGTELRADSSQLLAALPIIIREARLAGYHFVTLSEMLG